MRHLILVLVLLFFLVGCAGMPIPGVTAVAPITNVGDKADQIVNENITNVSTTFLIIYGIACWVSPSPQQIFGAIGNFILKLFGRK